MTTFGKSSTHSTRLYFGAAYSHRFHKENDPHSIIAPHVPNQASQIYRGPCAKASHCTRKGRYPWRQSEQEYQSRRSMPVRNVYSTMAIDPITESSPKTTFPRSFTPGPT